MGRKTGEREGEERYYLSWEEYDNEFASLENKKEEEERTYLFKKYLAMQFIFHLSMF